MDDELLVGTSNQNDLYAPRMWNHRSGVCIFEWNLEHKSYVCALVRVDRVSFLTGSYDKTIKLWGKDIKESQCSIELADSCYSILVLPSG